MARNPWLTINPIKNIAMTQEGFNLVFGGIGKLISWIWMLCGVALVFYGYLVLQKAKSLEGLIANAAMVVIGSNWLISLFTIGDHRFRIPILSFTLFFQAIGFKHLIQKNRNILYL